MAFRLIAGGIKRFEGYSYDVRPYPGLVTDDGYAITAADLPVGSVFDELDTAARYHWTGLVWEHEPSPVLAALDRMAARQDETLNTMRNLYEGLILAGYCIDVR